MEIAEYNEITAGVGLAKKFGDKISIGLKVNYHQIKILNYGSSTSFSVDAGIMYNPNNQFTIGFYVSNPSKQKFNSLNVSNPIQSTINIGAAYKASDKILIATTVSRNLTQKLDVGIGIEYQLIELISLRGGMSVKPFKQYGGVGLKHKKFLLNLAIENDPNLGYSSQIAIGYAF